MTTSTLEDVSAEHFVRLQHVIYEHVATITGKGSPPFSECNDAVKIGSSLLSEISSTPQTAQPRLLGRALR